MRAAVMRRSEKLGNGLVRGCLFPSDAAGTAGLQAEPQTVAAATYTKAVKQCLMLIALGEPYAL